MHHWLGHRRGNDGSRQPYHVRQHREPHLLSLCRSQLVWIWIVYLLYPETSNRSLESIEAMFSTPSPFYWNMEKAYADNKQTLFVDQDNHARWTARAEDDAVSSHEKSMT